MEMASQSSFNMNTSLMRTLRPGCELPGIFGKQTSPRKLQNVWNPSARFLLCKWEAQVFSSPPPLPSALTLPKPHLLSGHLKFIKCDSMITFTHTVFDLLSLNYHKAVQRRTSHRLLFCATVIVFLIFGGEEYWYCSADLISEGLHCDERREGSGCAGNKRRRGPAAAVNLKLHVWLNAMVAE